MFTCVSSVDFLCDFPVCPRAYIPRLSRIDFLIAKVLHGGHYEVPHGVIYSFQITIHNHRLPRQVATSVCHLC